ncbi:MAG: type II toxin-antitoxin system PemK/MazF family toxin [Armatimonadetes bacterium]|nr:type II toxin-antitoxin system PemK/MazF family toxin [Armatimonadota bacterium]
MPKPERGEVWRVFLEPTVGDEIGKARPAIVMSLHR